MSASIEQHCIVIKRRDMMHREDMYSFDHAICIDVEERAILCDYR